MATFSKTLEAEDLKKVDKAGQAWKFPCFIEQSGSLEFVGRKDARANPSAISVRWRAFIHQKDARVGDTVFLHQVSMDDNRMEMQLRIEVKKKIKLFGVDLWAVV
ncbi:hypothetical protein QUC31_002001 [Theobroma cacao]|uniref:Uncharacterized protein LOC18593836 n=1 Tax=Theobroma cacao TaxID=3641 RepID=A0AB32WS31_THECC|nr:PREDICTED: uncharacterized protein LOC18593836 [Theobroma cacao]WRX28133.1 hypothetical protein QQP08_020620 [Theobroma cacao]